MTETVLVSDHIASGAQTATPPKPSVVLPVLNVTSFDGSNTLWSVQDPVTSAEVSSTLLPNRETTKVSFQTQQAFSHEIITNRVVVSNSGPGTAVTTMSTPAPSAKSRSVDLGPSWDRMAYFLAQTGIADNVVFLNNMGGQGSGTWDSTFGSSLSYASKDSQSGASFPMVFAGALRTNTELAIFSNTSCSTSSCDFYRDHIPAYRRSSFHSGLSNMLIMTDGYEGSSKLFIFEFSMPHDGGSSSSTGPHVDMPAIWMLNSQIPRTGQYLSQPGCSCWSSGCGELDIVETLSAGNTRLISTVHSSAGNTQGACFLGLLRATSGQICQACSLDE